MNMQAIMKQAQTMQKEMLKAKEEIDKMEFTAENGLVTVKMNGAKVMLEVIYNLEEDFAVEDIEMLADMTVVATNNCLKQIDEVTEKKMGKYTSGLPGLF